MIDKGTFISLSIYLRDAINNIKEERCHFNHIVEMGIVTLAQKRDKTCDFVLKHNMPAFEWKLNALINRDKNLINKFPQNWRHPIITKFDCYRINIIQMEFVKQYVFYNPNIEGIDEINDKASSDCSNKHIHSYKPLRLVYNIKTVDMKENKTEKYSIKRYTNWRDVVNMGKEKRDISIGEIKQKQRYRLIKINKLTLQLYGNNDDLKICYYIKITLPLTP